MNTVGIKLGALALGLLAVVSLIPYAGAFVLAPLIALAIGAIAGRQAAQAGGSRRANDAATAGALVGVGALLGSIVGLTLLLVLVLDIPAVQEYIRTSEPNAAARIPYEWMVPLGAVGGVVVGLAAGSFDLLVALLGGLLAGLVYDHNRRRPA